MAQGLRPLCVGPVGALARDAKLLGDVSDWPAVFDDTLNEQTTAVQTSVSVGHEDLLGERMT